jgi:hypothetical protein
MRENNLALARSFGADAVAREYVTAYRRIIGGEGAPLRAGLAERSSRA